MDDPRLIVYRDKLGRFIKGTTGFWRGRKHSKETKEKLRLIHIGLKHTEETKKRLSIIHKGKKLSKETRIKMSKSFKDGYTSGKRIAYWRGKYHSQEYKQKMSEAQKKRYALNPVSTETKEKLRLINRGRKCSEETKRKMSKGRKGKNNHNWGKPHTQEWRQKVSLAHRKRWDLIGRKQDLRPKHHCQEYSNWRRTIFIRDEFTCQECKKTHTYLNVHHIKPWARYPELRYEINNGTTLCKDCHKLKHSKNER